MAKIRQLVLKVVPLQRRMIMDYLRMSSELHSRVAAFVAATGTTINDFINRAIKNELNKVAL
ncbi:MAG: hypothetical protein VZR53_15820 [Prevotella sp.]|nr:hypothetical protein [Prevotella sp.]